MNFQLTFDICLELPLALCIYMNAMLLIWSHKLLFLSNALQLTTVCNYFAVGIILDLPSGGAYKRAPTCLEHAGTILEYILPFWHEKHSTLLAWNQPKEPWVLVGEC